MEKDKLLRHQKRPNLSIRIARTCKQNPQKRKAKEHLDTLLNLIILKKSLRVQVLRRNETEIPIPDEKHAYRNILFLIVYK